MDESVAKPDTRLAVTYEAIRRREYELITKLLDVLPKVDGLGDEQVGQVRDALFHADHPYLMVFVGPFSSGKSSLINALLGKNDLLAVGPIPTTDRISILRYGEQPNVMRSSELDTVFYPSTLLQKVSFVDTPGLESVFQKHEEVTRKFLHRADTVLLVMMATQAMTARNLDYLRMLRSYGKNVILILNQVDLLSDEERETVRQYVSDQSSLQLGFKPEVWMMSAKLGLQARNPDGTLDPEKWRASGLDKLEQYVDDQLGDVARMKQKLQTPLSITQNAHQSALSSVRTNQAALDQYQAISQNLEQQLSVHKREQDKILREIDDEITAKFTEASNRGTASIREMFKINRALGSVGRGVLELVGLSRLQRSGSYTRAEFEMRKVFEPIGELPNATDKIAPRLEGKDIQDIDDLVKYARREITALPPAIQAKVIGDVKAPLGYDRSALQQVRGDLEQIETEAKTFETSKLDTAVRNSLLYLAGYEVLLLLFVVFVLILNPSATTTDQPWLTMGLALFFIGLGVMGLLLLPLRGRALEAQYANRLLGLQARYLELFNKAAEKQIAYGMHLRREAVAPLTRLIEAQTTIQTDQLKALQSAGQEITEIEAELTAMGNKTGLLAGLRG
ncbi:MAG: dynamin family protein [Anaerolineae bacterium]